MGGLADLLAMPGNVQTQKNPAIAGRVMTAPIVREVYTLAEMYVYDAGAKNRAPHAAFCARL